MTLQEIFDAVASHLLTQNHQAKIHGKCVYRAADGSKCAVGCLISDEAYSKRLENKCVGSPPVKSALFQSGIVMDENLLGLLSTLQSIHDLKPPELWPEQLAFTAKRWQLNTFVLRACVHRFGR